MYLCEFDIPPIVIVSPGRLGDLVTAEAMFRKIHESEPHRPVVFYTLPAFAPVMAHCPYITLTLSAQSKADLAHPEEKFQPQSRFIKVNLSHPEMPLPARPGIDQSWNLLNTFQYENRLPLENGHSKFYLECDRKPDGLPEKYIVFHCQSNGKSRQWRLKHWKKLAKFCISRRMPVVEIGFGSLLNLETPGYFDECHHPDIHDTARIIRHASAVVGIESGMLHIANALGVFGFIITGALHHKKEYNHYCGSYYEKKNCNFLRYYGENPWSLPYEVAEAALAAFLDGKPFTDEECASFCYRHQLEKLQNSFAGKIRHFFTDFVHKIAMSRQFHQRPKRK